MIANVPRRTLGTAGVAGAGDTLAPQCEVGHTCSAARGGGHADLPKQKNGFAKLSDEHQTTVRALAGVLRLARSLRKSGLENAVGLRCEKSAEAIVLSVPGLLDTAEIAARLAAAKHLLESVTEKPLILKSVPRPVKVPEPIAQPPESPLVSAAFA